MKDTRHLQKAFDMEETKKKKKKKNRNLENRHNAWKKEHFKEL